jgi:serine phosphatase RsbU (regulator of sigma subunit)
MTNTIDQEVCASSQNRQGLGLGLKFILLVAVIVSLTLGGLNGWAIHSEQQVFREHLEEKAGILGQLLAFISPEAILAYDYTSLETFVKQVSRQKDVVYSVVRDAFAKPMTSYLDQDNALVRAAFAQAGGQADYQAALAALSKHTKLIHMQFPIYGPHENLLGEVEIGVDTARMRAYARQSLWRGVIAGGAMIAFLSLAIYLVFQFSALRPINTLTEAAVRVSGGDFSRPIRIYADDELGKLSACFNSMMARLKHTLRELQTLNQTLETRVDERTLELAQANSEITLLNARLQAENQRMGAELEITRRLQQMALPKSAELRAIQELDIAAFMEPAEEIGGDYYDVLQQDGRIKIGIGDVTGHGLESGVLMLMVQMAVRTLLAGKITDPEEFLSILNRVIFDSVQRMEIDKNLTLSLLDYQAGALRLTGQHEEILIARRGGAVERLDTIDLGFMLGLEQDIRPFISHSRIDLEPGDGVVLYTDGVTEARNPLGKAYGLDRLSQVVGENWPRDAGQIQQAVIADLLRHIDGAKIADDITLLVIKQK